MTDKNEKKFNQYFQNADIKPEFIGVVDYEIETMYKKLYIGRINGKYVLYSNIFTELYDFSDMDELNDIVRLFLEIEKETNGKAIDFWPYVMAGMEFAQRNFFKFTETLDEGACE